MLFPDPSRRTTTVILMIIGLWITAAMVALAGVGTLGYILYHFVHKAW